jgi:hypothetical protein
MGISLRTADLAFQPAHQLAGQAPTGSKVLTGLRMVCSTNDLAPQVSLGRRFMSGSYYSRRVSYASWSDDFVGLIGGTDFANESDGLTAGMHMEV